MMLPCFGAAVQPATLEDFPWSSLTAMLASSQPEDLGGL
jgi:hypothetical protein